MLPKPSALSPPSPLVIGPVTPLGPPGQLDRVSFLLRFPTFVPPLQPQVQMNVCVIRVLFRRRRPYRSPIPLCVKDTHLRPAEELPRWRTSSSPVLGEPRDGMQIAAGQPIRGNWIHSEKDLRQYFRPLSFFLASSCDFARPARMNTPSDRFGFLDRRNTHRICSHNDAQRSSLSLSSHICSRMWLGRTVALQ